jgi:hypothetical protein
MKTLAALALVVSLAACDSEHTRECERSQDCLQGGISGTCRASPVSTSYWCSYPDPECPSPPGERWGLLAGDGLAKVCVAPGAGADAGVADAGLMDGPVDGIDGGTDAGTDAVTYLLNVMVSGPGSVSSSPPGIACGATCSQVYAGPTTVQLTATPDPGHQFSQWMGPCAEPLTSTTCTVVVSGTLSVVATFVP